MIDKEKPADVKVSLSLPKFPTTPTLVYMKMFVKSVCSLLEKYVWFQEILKKLYEELRDVQVGSKLHVSLATMYLSSTII